jgi:hypothetical protein
LIAALVGCSSEPASKEAKKAVTLHKIQGRTQVIMDQTGAGDAPLNSGQPPVFLLDGSRRYRLFSRKAITVDPGAEYVVEGIDAQKVIDEIGDPALGKGGYPLQASCERVVRMAWTGLPFDEFDVKVSVLKARVGRYPARPVFLVVKMDKVETKESDDKKKKGPASEKDLTVVTIPADKMKALLKEGSPVTAAPLWEPAGGTSKCKVVVDPEGKVSELETGAQLCEYFDWAKMRYQPTVQGGKPAHVRTEVELRFDPRK